MVTRAYYIVSLFLLCYCMHSCSIAVLGVFSKDRLRIKKSSQIENIDRLALKINGVYIGEHKDDRKKGWKSCFILFSDGLCYFLLNLDDDLESIVDYFEQNKKLPNYSPIGWGIFDIHGDTLNMASWRVMGSSIADYNRLALSGKILDSETISIDKAWGLANETVFHFHPLKNKPDSTNRFIK